MEAEWNCVCAVRMFWSTCRRLDGGSACGGAADGRGNGIAVGHGRVGVVDHDGVVGRVLDQVEGDVAEVALVGDTVAAAEAGFAVAEDVIGKAEARGDGAVLRVPEPADGAVGYGKHGAVADLGVQRGAGAVVEVGVEVAVVVVLDAEVLVAHAVVEGEAGPWLFHWSCT